MNDPHYDITLIERYFDEELTAEERVLFERRLSQDSGFKRLFDQERHLIGAIRLEGALNDLEYLKAVENGDIISGLNEVNDKDIQPGTESKLGVLMPYLLSAAACLLIVIVAIFYLKSETPQQMASKYTEENLMYLSPTMSDELDSLQMGIAAFNSKDHERAARIFESLAENSGSLEAIKNLGLTYLALGEYDSALRQFELLSNRDDIHFNAGPFYKAVTLMSRSAPGDEEVAKGILEEVVRKQLPGHQVASSWLDRW